MEVSSTSFHDDKIIPTNEENKAINEVESIEYYQSTIESLQKENWNTRKDLKLTKIRLESVSIQLAAEKSREDDIIRHSEREFKILEKKLQNAESLLRKQEQLKRDETSIVTNISSEEFEHVLEDYNKLRSQIIHLGDEIQNKSRIIFELTAELEQYRPYESLAKHGSSSSSSLLLQPKFAVTRRMEGLDEKLRQQAKEYESKIELVQKSHQEEIRTMECRIGDLELQLVQTEEMMTKMQSNTEILLGGGNKNGNNSAFVIADMQNELMSIRNMRGIQLKQLHEKRIENKELKQEKISCLDLFRKYIQGSEDIIHNYEKTCNNYLLKLDNQTKLSVNLQKQVSKLKEYYKYPIPQVIPSRGVSTSSTLSKSDKKSKKNSSFQKLDNHKEKTKLNLDVCVVETQTVESDFPTFQEMNEESDTFRSGSLHRSESNQIPLSTTKFNRSKSFSNVRLSQGNGKQNIHENVLTISESEENRNIFIKEQEQKQEEQQRQKGEDFINEVIINETKKNLDTMFVNELSHEKIINMVDNILHPINFFPDEITQPFVLENISKVTIPSLVVDVNIEANHILSLQDINMNSNISRLIPDLINDSNNDSNNDNSITVTVETNDMISMNNSVDNQRNNQIDSPIVTTIMINENTNSVNIIDEDENDSITETMIEKEFMEEMRQTIVAQVEKASHQINDLVLATTGSILRQSSSIRLGKMSRHSSLDYQHIPVMSPSIATLDSYVPDLNTNTNTNTNTIININAMIPVCKLPNSSPIQMIRSPSTSLINEIESKQGQVQSDQNVINITNHLPSPVTIASEILVGLAESMGQQLIMQQNHYQAKKMMKNSTKSKKKIPSYSLSTPKGSSPTPKSLKSYRSLKSPTKSTPKQFFKVSTISVSTDVNDLMSTLSIGCQTNTDIVQNTLEQSHSVESTEIIESIATKSKSVDENNNDNNTNHHSNEYSILDSPFFSSKPNIHQEEIRMQTNHLKDSRSHVNIRDYIRQQSIQEMTKSDSIHPITIGNSDHIIESSNQSNILSDLSSNIIIRTNSKGAFELDTEKCQKPLLFSQHSNLYENPSFTHRSALLAGRIKHSNTETKRVKTLASVQTQTDPVSVVDTKIEIINTTLYSTLPQTTEPSNQESFGDILDTSAIIDSIMSEVKNEGKNNNDDDGDSKKNEEVESKNQVDSILSSNKTLDENSMRMMDTKTDSGPVEVNSSSNINDCLMGIVSTENPVKIVDETNRNQNEVNMIINSLSSSFQNLNPVDYTKSNIQTSKSIHPSKSSSSNMNDDDDGGGRSNNSDYESKHSKLQYDDINKDIFRKAANLYLREVLSNQFQFLIRDDIGGEILAKLTTIEYHLQCQNYEAVLQLGINLPLQNSSHGQDVHLHQQMLIQFMKIERDLLQKDVITTYTLPQLAKIRFITNKLHDKMKTFSIWKRLGHLLDTNGQGFYLDILKVHMDTIDKSIALSGGWNEVYREIQLNASKTCMSDTSYYPDNFRVKVLEHYRNMLFNQGSKWKSAYLSMDTEFQQMKIKYLSDQSTWNDEKNHLQREINHLRDSYKHSIIPKNMRRSSDLSSIESYGLSPTKTDNLTIDALTLYKSPREDNNHNNKNNHITTNSDDSVLRNMNLSRQTDAAIMIDSSTQTMAPIKGVISKLLEKNNLHSNSTDTIIGYHLSSNPKPTVKTNENIKPNKNSLFYQGDQIVLSQRGIIDNYNITNKDILPPGYSYVKVMDHKVMISPGITVAIPKALINNMILRQSIPKNILYIHRDHRAILPKEFEIIDKNSYSKNNIPIFEDECEAVRVLSNTIKIRLGVYIILDPIYLDQNIVLPYDIMCMKISSDNKSMPTGCIVADIHPRIQLILLEPLENNIELVQNHLSTLFPIGTSIGNNIEIVSIPNHLSNRLPYHVQAIKRLELNAEIPSYMTLLKPIYHSKPIEYNVNDSYGCVIRPFPKGIIHPLGVEILYKPSWYSYPKGVTLVPIANYPKEFKESKEKLHDGEELIQFEPIYDLPITYKPHPLWKIYPRPINISLPPNIYLLEYIGTEYDPMESLPLHIVPITDYSIEENSHTSSVNNSLTLPNNVILCTFLSNAGYPLPYGSELSDGIIVISKEIGIGLHPLSNPIPLSLAIDTILVYKKHPNNILPEGIEIIPITDNRLKGVKYMSSNIELVRIPVRFEIPVGIGLSPGVTLGSYTSFSPNISLANNINVLPIPPGIELPRDVHLVRLPSHCPLPYGYRQVQVVPKITTAATVTITATTGIGMDRSSIHLPKDSILIQFPRDQYIGCNTIESNKHITLIDGEKYISNTNLSINLPVGYVFIRRNIYNASFPTEFRHVEYSSLSDMNRDALDYMNQYKDDGDDENINIDKIGIVSIKPHYSYPIGIELSKGVYTQPIPYWLDVPTNVSIVSFTPNALELYKNRYSHNKSHNTILNEDENDTENKNRLKTYIELEYLFKEFLTMEFIQKNRINIKSQIMINKKNLSLHPFTVAIVIPENTSIYSWSSYCDAIKAVSSDYNHRMIENVHLNQINSPSKNKNKNNNSYNHKNFGLPPNHFLIEWSNNSEQGRNHILPLELATGLSEEYRYMLRPIESSYEMNNTNKSINLCNLPPGIEIVHIRPTYRLPRGISIESISAMRHYNNNITISQQKYIHSKEVKPTIMSMSMTAYMERKYYIPQLAWGEPISSTHISISYPNILHSNHDLFMRNRRIVENNHNDNYNPIIVAISLINNNDKNGLQLPDESLLCGEVLSSNTDLVEELFPYDIFYHDGNENDSNDVIMMNPRNRVQFISLDNILEWPISTITIGSNIINIPISKSVSSPTNDSITNRNNHDSDYEYSSQFIEKVIVYPYLILLPPPNNMEPSSSQSSSSPQPIIKSTLELTMDQNMKTDVVAIHHAMSPGNIIKKESKQLHPVHEFIRLNSNKFESKQSIHDFKQLLSPFGSSNHIDLHNNSNLTASPIMTKNDSKSMTMTNNTTNTVLSIQIQELSNENKCLKESIEKEMTNSRRLKSIVNELSRDLCDIIHTFNNTIMLLNTTIPSDINRMEDKKSINSIIQNIWNQQDYKLSPLTSNPLSLSVTMPQDKLTSNNNSSSNSNMTSSILDTRLGMISTDSINKDYEVEDNISILSDDDNDDGGGNRDSKISFNVGIASLQRKIERKTDHSSDDFSVNSIESIHKINYNHQYKKTKEDIVISASLSALKSPRNGQFLSGKIRTSIKNSNSSSKPRQLPPISMSVLSKETIHDDQRNHSAATGGNGGGDDNDITVDIMSISKPIRLHTQTAGKHRRQHQQQDGRQNVYWIEDIPNDTVTNSDGINNDITNKNSSNNSNIGDHQSVNPTAPSELTFSMENITVSDIISLDSSLPSSLVFKKGLQRKNSHQTSSIMLDTTKYTKNLLDKLNRLSTESIIIHSNSDEQNTLRDTILPWIKTMIFAIQDNHIRIERRHQREITTLYQETTSILRQYENLQQKLTCTEEELRNKRLQSYEQSVHENMDRLQAKNMELTNIINMIRTQDIRQSIVISKLSQRVENLRNLIDLNEYLYFQLLYQKSELKSMEDRSLVENGINPMSDSIIKAVSHYRQSVRKKIATIISRRNVLRKDIEVMMNVIYEDYREYESNVRSLLPSSLLSRIRILFPNTQSTIIDSCSSNDSTDSHIIDQGQGHRNNINTLSNINIQKSMQLASSSFHFPTEATTVTINHNHDYDHDHHDSNHSDQISQSSFLLSSKKDKVDKLTSSLLRNNRRIKKRMIERGTRFITHTNDLSKSLNYLSESKLVDPRNNEESPSTNSTVQHFDIRKMTTSTSNYPTT